MKKKHIIVAEDDISIQDIIRIILEEEEHKVSLFLTGDSIIENHFEMPDLFILDKQLPGIDGLDICRHLKSQVLTRNIPVIMLSASPTIKILAKDAGADDSLEKPFKINSLREIVRRFL